MDSSKSPQLIKPKPLNVGDTIDLISPADIIFEDVGEDIYRIDRMLTQLKANGILD